MPDPPPTSHHRTPSGSVDPAYFEALYLAEADPWAYGSSAYEAAKYAHTLNALPRSRYRRALEIGCSIGVLTRDLAGRCDHLLALDASAAALERARERCRGLANVSLHRATVPAETPEGPFDLVVLSEAGYYLSHADLALLLRQLATAVGPGGHLVLVHWTGETDYPLQASDVHEAFGSDPAWCTRRDESRDEYRLSVLERI